MKSLTVPSAILRTVLCVILTLTFVRAQDKTPTLKEAKADFDKADRALNAAWEAVKKDYGESRMAALKEEQRAWVEYRDYTSLSPGFSGAPADEAKAKQSAEYFSTAASLTTTRTAWLKGLIAKDTGDSITGKWNDSYGGWLEIVEKDGRLYFTIEVVRGPTAHVGGLAGIAAWNTSIGWYSDKGLDKTKSEETNLSFVQRDGKMQLTGANTSHYHGARAYFDGDYVKVGSLDAKAQAAVIKSAKEGTTGQ
jgi:uncharacterized protein YecT (DUF1311 family)